MEVIRIRKLKGRQLNYQKKKDKQGSTKHTHKTKDRETRTTFRNQMKYFSWQRCIVISRLTSYVP